MPLRALHVLLSFGKELRETLRDRRTLAVMILFPLVVYPLLALGAGQMALRREKSHQARASVVAITGTGSAREDLAEQIRQRRETFVLVPSGTPADVERGRLDALLQVEAGPRVRIVYDASRDESREAADRLGELLASLLPTGCAPLFPTEKDSVAPETEVGAYLLSKVLPLLVVLMVLLGAFYPAIDVTAGERERGTLETVLVCPMRRFDLLLGKVMAVSVLAALSGLLNLASMSVTLVQLARLTEPSSMLHVPWAHAAAAALVVFPSAFLFAAVFVAVGAVARGSKEAQTMMTPVYFLSVAPALAGALGEFQLSGVRAWIPGMNVTLLARDLLLGRVAWTGMLAALGSTVAYGCAALSVAARIYSSEQFVDLPRARRFDQARLRPAAPTAGQAMLLFALAFVLLYFVWLPLQRHDLTTGLLASEWGGLLGLTLIFSLFTGRPITQTLRLARPSARSWLGAGLIGAAAWAGVAIISQWITPVPKEVVEQLRRSLIPTDGSRGFLATLGLVALTPAICEEALFRGPILRGLRSSLSPAAAALVTGALFGLFHLDLARVLPTALLGVLLSYVALWSGSILPAMLAHFLNNAIVLALAFSGWDERLTMVGPARATLVLLASAAVTAVGVRLLWRNAVRSEM